MSELPKTKKKSAQRKAGSSPIPGGPGNALCGHGGLCSMHVCKVTYAGPVSRMHDHHVIMASHGTKHIWPAAVITSLALLVTGTVAFSSVSAGQDQRAQALQKQAANRNDVQKILIQLNRIERILTDMGEATAVKPTAREMMDKMNGLPVPEAR